MSDQDTSEWRLIGTTLAASSTDRILPVLSSHFYQVLNESGSGEVSIPLDSAAAGVVTEGMLAVLYYRGAIRASFLIENIRKVPASSQEEAGQVLSISGRGGMTLLDRAIVWSDGTTATTRTFTNTKAGVLIALITEAQARGGLSTLTYDFDATNDSAAVAWTDSDEYKLTVGTTLLDVLRGFAETGIEFEMNYSGTGFVLSAYKNGIGTDKSSTVYFRIGTNCQEIDIDQRGNDIKNALLVTHETGSTVITDGTSITANGRREELLDARYAQSTSAATTYGAAILATVKDTRIGRTIKVYDGHKTEIHKLRDGYGDWYLYAWESEGNRITEYALIDIHKARHLFTQDRNVIPNTDNKTGFYSYSIEELAKCGALIAYETKQ